MTSHWICNEIELTGRTWRGNEPVERLNGTEPLPQWRPRAKYRNSSEAEPSSAPVWADSDWPSWIWPLRRRPDSPCKLPATHLSLGISPHPPYTNLEFARLLFEWPAFVQTLLHRVSVLILADFIQSHLLAEFLESWQQSEQWTASIRSLLSLQLFPQKLVCIPLFPTWMNWSTKSSACS